MPEKYAVLRERMVREQLVGRGIRDEEVLDVFRRIPRHCFVPAFLKGDAYGDFPLPIGSNQTISQPYIVALMTRELGLTGGEKVLEIGTGSGYQTAILAALSGEVYSVERFAELLENAKRNLDELRISNVRLRCGDGTLGWEEAAPFDRIIVTAAAPEPPVPLIEQLRDPGRMILPLGGIYGQTLSVLEKEKGEIKTGEICGCVFVPLVGQFGWNEGHD